MANQNDGKAGALGPLRGTSRTILSDPPKMGKAGGSRKTVASQKRPTPKPKSDSEKVANPISSQPKPEASRIEKPSSAEARKRVSGPAAEEPSPPKPEGLTGAKKAALPKFIKPMLASLSRAVPAGEAWLHEIKFDGYRLQARIEAGRVRLLTRSGLDWTAKFGKSIPATLADLPIGSAVLDGEVVVETGNGASDFSALQAALSDGQSEPFLFYAFDLMYLEGYDLTALPLIQRKEMLKALVAQGVDPLRYSSHFTEGGGHVLRHACRLGLEGILSKQSSSPYRSGRSRVWLKSKCSARQEFVIGGYVPATSTKAAIGSLVLGAFEQGKLDHVGRVGTGFTGAVARDLFQKFEHLRSDETPFAAPLTPDQKRGVRWLRPELVAEVDFRAWTADGHLRHASFRGLREDKLAKEVIREGGKVMARAQEPKPPQRVVKLTHPHRLFWPEDGVTKERLADFYAEIWPQIGPFVVNRPLALLRCPTGIEGEKFFQKHLWKGAPSEVSEASDPKKPGEPMICISDMNGLMGLVQSAALEIHPWGATLSDWERPDMLTMDLDPGERVDWQQVIDAAEEVRQRLTDLGLTAFVKTSGGKGLHVVAPLTPRMTWPELKSLAKAMADAMAADSPDRYVSTIAKAKRRGKVLIDYLRNQRGATAVAAYSTRARPGAAVSTPIFWDELGPEIGPDFFTLKTLPTRLQSQKRDPWEGFWEAAVPLKRTKADRKS